MVHVLLMMVEMASVRTTLGMINSLPLLSLMVQMPYDMS